MTKLLDGVSFAEFAKLINRSKGYISQMKSANRLVLTDDGKRVLVEESRARMKTTSDPSKWPVALSHEAERRRKGEVVADCHGLIPDPYDDFMADLLADSRVEIVAGLMAEVGLSFETASLAFDEMIACISDIRMEQGFRPDRHVPNPRDQIMPEAWREEIKAEIEARARELELLREKEI